MNRSLKLATLVLVSAVPMAQAEPNATIPVVQVWGTAETPATTYTLDVDNQAPTAPDTADLLRQVPGANLNANGPLTGIAQYRGMYGSRINVLIDGINIPGGGPNAMDPPLSYIPRDRLKNIVVVRGIAPVSSGDETIGGTVSATSRQSQFTSGSRFEFHGNAQAGIHSVDEGYSASILATLANDDQRLEAAVTRTAGDDRDFAGGTIRPSGYGRDVFEAGYGFRSGDQEAGIDYQRINTGHTGTPALPMDIIYINTNLVRGNFQGMLGPAQFIAKLYYTDVDHRMDNYSLRQAANPAMRRFTLAGSQATGYDLRMNLPLDVGQLSLGTDGLLASHDANIHDPGNPMFLVNNFRNVQRNRYGVFGEWDADVSHRWHMQLGVRYTRVDMSSGTVDGTPARMMPPAALLRDRFNAGDRNRTDNNVDWVAKLEYRPRKDLRLELAVGRKTRSPSYQEAYLWVPLQSTGGLADGNNYVGNPNLRPEVSHEIDLGFDWRGAGAYLSPLAFYRNVDNYIQGVPATDPAVIMVSTMNGDTTPLQFANVGARFYGVDTNWGVALGGHWSLDGVLSYVRGQRRDIHDNLYRIAPLNATVDLSQRHDDWSVTLEGVFYVAQHDVSKTNGELPSAGYGLLNLHGQYKFPQHGLSLTAGIDNILNKRYAPHLGGINRVMGMDVPPGTYLPGSGINGFVNVNMIW